MASTNHLRHHYYIYFGATSHRAVQLRSSRTTIRTTSTCWMSWSKDRTLLRLLLLQLGRKKATNEQTSWATTTWRSQSRTSRGSDYYSQRSQGLFQADDVWWPQQHNVTHYDKSSATTALMAKAQAATACGVEITSLQAHYHNVAWWLQQSHYWSKAATTIDQIGWKGWVLLLCWGGDVKTTSAKYLRDWIPLPNYWRQDYVTMATAWLKEKQGCVQHRALHTTTTTMATIRGRMSTTRRQVTEETTTTGVMTTVTTTCHCVCQWPLQHGGEERLTTTGHTTGQREGTITTTKTRKTAIIRLLWEREWLHN